MADASNRVVVIFAHPKHTEKEPRLVGVNIQWLVANGIPHTEKGKPWIYHSTELLHQRVTTMQNDYSFDMDEDDQLYDGILSDFFWGTDYER